MNHQTSEAWGDFLNTFPWDWFCTFTHRESVGSFKMVNLFSRFIRELEHTSEKPVFWFRTQELTKAGNTHVHALIGNVSHIRPVPWRKRWEEMAGFARIKVYDPKLGAAFYCAKNLGSDRNEWQFSENIHFFGKAQGEKSNPLTLPPTPSRQVDTYFCRFCGKPLPLGFRGLYHPECLKNDKQRRTRVRRESQLVKFMEWFNRRACDGCRSAITKSTTPSKAGDRS